MIKLRISTAYCITRHPGSRITLLSGAAARVNIWFH